MKRLFIGLALALAALAGFGQTNSGGTLMPLVAYTATVNSNDMDNPYYKGVHIVITGTSWTSGTFTPHIQGKDPASGTYYDILVGASGASTIINTTLCSAATPSSPCQIVLKVYPGIGTITNGAAADIIPRTWRVSMVGASTPSATFSVSYFYEP